MRIHSTNRATRSTVIFRRLPHLRSCLGLDVRVLCAAAGVMAVMVVSCSSLLDSDSDAGGGFARSWDILYHDTYNTTRLFCFNTTANDFVDSTQLPVAGKVRFALLSGDRDHLYLRVNTAADRIGAILDLAYPSLALIDTIPMSERYGSLVSSGFIPSPAGGVFFMRLHSATDPQVLEQFLLDETTYEVLYKFPEETYVHAFSPDGRLALTSDTRNSYHIRPLDNLGDSRYSFTLPAGIAGLGRTVINENGTEVFSLTSEGEFTVIDARSGAALFTAKLPSGRGIALTPDGQSVVLSSPDQGLWNEPLPPGDDRLRIYSVRQRTIIATVDAKVAIDPDSGYYALAPEFTITPDSKWLVSSGVEWGPTHGLVLNLQTLAIETVFPFAGSARVLRAVGEPMPAANVEGRYPHGPAPDDGN